MSFTTLFHKFCSWRSVLGTMAISCFVSTGSAQSQELVTQGNAENQNSVSFEQVKKIEMENIEAGAESQRKIDVIDTQRRALSDSYRGALKQHADLKKYNHQLSELIRSQKEEEQSLKAQISRISHLERDVVPLMTDMLDTLEKFILLDVPFLLEERKKRVQNLRALMIDANVTNSEKYRRILEAYQIENDYGRSIEAYDGTVDDTGTGAQSVTFLKVGRVALLYQTLDAEQSYRWVDSEKNWQQLNDSYNTQLRNGIKMAREQMPPNLLLVPVNAPAS